MAGAKDTSKLGYRILLGAVVLVLGGSMLLYLVPQSPVSGEVSTDTVAKIGDESVSMQDVRQQLSQLEQRNPNMKPIEALYAQQILKQLVFEKEIEYEAKRLGIAVSDQERADRIRQYRAGVRRADPPGLAGRKIPQARDRRDQCGPRRTSGWIPL